MLIRLRVRVFRPWPFEQIKDALKHLKIIGVMDRAEGMSGFGGPLFVEVRSTLAELDNTPKIYNFIYGLGGKDTKPVHIKQVVSLLEDAISGKEIEKINYTGVRE